MSHKLKLYAYNNTTHTLKTFSIAHSWNDNSESLDGSNLPTKQRSTSIEITTGYGPEEDWYTIIADIDTIGTKSTDFFL